jgi:hypothetical protein
MDYIFILSLIESIKAAKWRIDYLVEPRISPKKSWMSYLKDFI